VFRLLEVVIYEYGDILYPLLVCTSIPLIAWILTERFDSRRGILRAFPAQQDSTEIV